MNRKKNSRIHTMVSLGAVLLALRLRLYIVAVDAKNLIAPGHFLSALIWIVAAAALALATISALGEEKREISKFSTPIAVLGDALFAFAIGLCAFSMEMPDTLPGKLCMAAGYLCVPAMLFAAFCRFRAKPVFFGCFGVVCIFFALHLVTCYQDWSSNPQLQDYLFAMLASGAVTLFSYQNTAAAVDRGNRAVWLASGLLAGCYGIAAIYHVENGWLYGAGAMWAVTTLLGEALQTAQEGN